MNTLLLDISSLSDLTLEVMQAVLEKETLAGEIMGEESAPIQLAQALSDFYQTAAVLESGDAYMEEEEITQFASYGMDLLDRLAYLVRQLELMNQRNNISVIAPSLALWLGRRGAELTNLEGAADGFGMLVNGLNETSELSSMCRMMEEVISAASEELQLDEDRSNPWRPWRPWRIINLNAGIAATRSLDPQLMEETFEKLGRRLPYDMAGFINDGKRQMLTSNVPDEVVEVINRYAEQWKETPMH